MGDDPDEDTSYDPPNPDGPGVPQQGTVIPCVDCTLLDGHLDPCPTCGGAKEHFQPARLADREVQYEMGREARARLDALRDGRDSEELAEHIRATLQETLVYGPAWVAGYRGADPKLVDEDDDDEDEDGAEAEENLCRLRRELKQAFFEAKE